MLNTVGVQRVNPSRTYSNSYNKASNVLYVQRNIQERLCNNWHSGKAVNIPYLVYL